MSWLCAGCDAVHDRARSPFCTGACAKQAAFVRAFRRYEANGWQSADGPEAARKAVIAQMRFVIAGITYQEFRAQQDLTPVIDKDFRESVLTRDDYKCAFPDCPTPATEVDHIDWSQQTGDDPEGLRSLCHQHHLDKTAGNLDTLEALGDITPEERDEAPTMTLMEMFDEVYRRLPGSVRERAEAPVPLLVCDQPDWGTSWRAWMKTRQRG